jgi:competence protein ComEC
MSIANRRLLLLFVVLFIVCGLCLREWQLRPDGRLHIRFFDVGQGDSALVTTPDGRTIVIDGGPDWSTLEELGKFLPFFSRQIDLLVLSHPNLDHLLSFPEILKRYSVRGIAFSGADDELPRYHEILARAEENDVPLIRVFAGQTIDIGNGARLDILWPPEKMPSGFSKNDNNASVVAMLRYKDHAALFTGDMEKPVEETLVRAKAPLKADILKVAHHGSRTSSSTGFLLAVRPTVAIVSVGKNSYGHPKPEIMKRLQEFADEVRRTDQGGTIEFVW